MELVKMHRHESYRDSGVDWIGEIPSEWNVKKVTHLFKNIGSGTTPSSGNASFYNGSIPWLQTGDLNDGIVCSTSKSISEKALKLHSALKIYKKGSLVIAMYGATIGKACIVDLDTTTNQACCVIESSSKQNTKFYFYVFLGVKGHILSMAYGGGQPNISQDLIRGLRLPNPHILEQTAIANFLNQKTAQIDEAITIKERQIELLKERKQIIIQKAVTQGLNPNVPMKDSGLEWIGKVPEHWGVKKLRYLGKTQNGISAGAEYFGSGYPFVSYGDVYNSVVLPSTVNGLANSSEQDQIQYSIKEGDVLFTRTSETVDEIGFASTCFKSIDKATFAGFLIRFRPSSTLLIKEFSRYYFSSQLMRKYFVKEMNLVIRASLSQELLKNLPVLLPSIGEQLEIFNYLEEQSRKFESLIDIQKSQIEKLKEYKTTLINSAVTGKIKVTDER